MNRRGFSLVELLLAVTLSVILMAAVLAAMGALARDARRLGQVDPSESGRPVVRMLAWDLSNSRTLIQAPDESMLVLVNHGGIDRQTAAPNGRLVRVIYQCVRERGNSWLVRDQQYLDDPARPQRYRELVAGGITNLSVTPIGEQSTEPDTRAQQDESIDLPLAVRAGAIMSVPSRVRLRITGPALAIDEQLLLK